MKLLGVVLVPDLLVAAHLFEDADGDHGCWRGVGRDAVFDEDGAAGDGGGADFGAS